MEVLNVYEKTAFYHSVSPTAAGCWYAHFLQAPRRDEAVLPAWILTCDTQEKIIPKRRPCVGGAFIPIVWLAVLMAGCYTPGMTIFDLVAQFTEVTKMPFALRWTPHTAKFIGIFLLLYGGAILFYYTGQKNTRPGEEHGSASWGSVRELDKKYRDKDAGKNVILTQHLQMSMNGKLHRRNLLQIIVGGSGSGKTRFLAKPNLMLANASFIVTDPKGEMLRAVGNLFLEEGYVLRVFDLIDPSKSDCYNPFCYIRKDADVFKLIDNFIKNTTPKGAKANDPFWEKSETALDAALMLYLLHEAPVEDQNMETILYMIENGGAKEEDDDYQSPLDLLFEALEEEQPDHIAVRQYHIFKQAAGKTAKSILVSAAVRLASFTLPEIQRITASDDMELSKLGERKQFPSSASSRIQRRIFELPRRYALHAGFSRALLSGGQGASRRAACSRAADVR